jgi:hypothetical protein
MKKNLILGLAIVMTLFSAVAYAEQGISVKIDSANVEFNDDIGRPFIDENSRTLVPFKAALEAFGAEVEWNNETRTAVAKKGDVTVEVPIGEPYVLKNGEKIESDTVAVIKEERTYLPIKKVMEAFGAEVQWDADTRTVNIITESVDAKAKILEAYEKFYAWKNYDMNALINMSMSVPGEDGSMQEVNMKMDMDATTFTDPMKMKATVNMMVDAGDDKLSQPLMEMYMSTKGNKYSTYMLINNPETGESQWVKQEIEDEEYIKLLDPNNEEMKALNEKSMTDVKYLGTYPSETGNLQKYEVTISYKDIVGLMDQNLSVFKDALGEDAQLGLDLLGSFDDVKCTIYLDESTGEFVKQEMDFSSLLSKAMEQMMGTIAEEAPEGVTEDEMNNVTEMLKNIKMDMVAEYKNINAAEDFEIPKEALDAIPAEDLIEVEESTENAKVEETEKE